MSVLIGHASIAEDGTVYGNPGDQTGREVCTRSWYNGGWLYVADKGVPLFMLNASGEWKEL